MAFNTIVFNVVFLRINTGDTMPLTCGIGKVCVATQTEPPTAVDGQLFRLIRVIKGRAVTILTRDNAVKVLGPNIHLVIVTLGAILVHFLLSGIAVLGWLSFRIIFCRETMVGVHESRFACSEIGRDIEQSENQNSDNDADGHNERPPDMTFHRFIPSEKWLSSA